MNHFDSKYLNSVVAPLISTDFEEDPAGISHRKERKNGFKYKDATEEDIEQILNKIQSKKVDKIAKDSNKSERKLTHCAVHGRTNVEPSHEQQEQVDMIQSLPHNNRSKLLSIIADDEIQHSEALENIEELQNEKSHYVPMIRHNSCRTGIGAPTLETIQEEATQSLSESDAQSDISDAKFSNENSNQQTVPTNCNSTLIVPKLDLDGLDDSSRDGLSPATIPKLTNDSKSNYTIQERKLIDIRKKIGAVLEKIMKQTIRIPEPDGFYDLLRRQKREAEFASRFSRNHLYQLKREILELNKQVKEANAPMHSSMKSIQRKIVTTHQHSLQALEVYHNQMLMLTVGGSLGKLAELVNYLVDLTKLCCVLNMKCVAFPGAPCFEEKAKHLQKLLSSNTADEVLGTHAESFQKIEHIPGVKTTNGRKKWENCLRSTNNLCVNKLAHSVYASSQSKVNKHKEQGKQNSGRKKKISLTAKLAKEETVKPKPLKQDDNLKMSSRLVPEDAFLRNLSEKIIEMCEERVREKIDVFVNDLVAEKKAQIKDKENAHPAPTQSKEVAAGAHESSSSVGDLISALHTDQEICVRTLSGSKSEHNLPGSKCTRTGSKNAQLICLEHNDQIDTNPLARGDAGVQQQQHQNHHHCLHHSEGPKPDNLHRKLAPEVEQHGPPPNEASSGPGMSSYASMYSPQVRSPFVKSFLAKEEEAQVLKYRKRYHSYMKTNPMYHGTKQPWVMVGKLSDQLVTETMESMAEEVQMQFLADELYNLEFEKKKRRKHKS